MVEFGESYKIIKIRGKWINQTLTMGSVVIFRALFTEELLQTKNFLRFSTIGRSSRGVAANVLNSDIVVSEFKLQSHYCVHFRTWERYEYLDLRLSSNELNTTTNVIL